MRSPARSPSPSPKSIAAAPSPGLLPADWLGQQFALMGAAARYWQDLASANLEMQAELWEFAMRQVNTEDVFGAARLFRA